MSYSKLHGSIIHSTIWMAPDHVRLVWITMLALKDRDGIVEASIPGLAQAARQTLEATEAALELLMAPDPYSRTPDCEGRRIEKVDGGWVIINHDKYRDKDDIDERRHKDAQRAARLRARRKVELATQSHVTSRDGHVTSRPSRENPKSPTSDTDTDLPEESAWSDPSGSEASSPQQGIVRAIPPHPHLVPVPVPVPAPFASAELSDAKLRAVTPATELTSFDLRAHDPDPRETERKRLHAKLWGLHAKAYARVRSAIGADRVGAANYVPPMAAVGDSAERALSALIREQGDLASFEERALHVLSVREAEAMKPPGSLRFFGKTVWGDGFGVAASMAVGEEFNSPTARERDRDHNVFDVIDKAAADLKAKRNKGGS